MTKSRRDLIIVLGALMLIITAMAFVSTLGRDSGAEETSDPSTDYWCAHSRYHVATADLASGTMTLIRYPSGHTEWVSC